MAQIELRNIWHSYENNDIYAISDVNITYEDGSAIALLGPSGCGKTTILSLVTGLLKPTRGQVLFDGVDVTHLSPKERHIALVFQFPVLYESMSVYGNLAFPLVNDGMGSREIKERVTEVAEIMGITHLLRNSSKSLTPADKQRVALGRGIVRPNTSAVLLDEPLTVIDPKAQWGLRRKLKEVQEELNMTMIYVTHDQHEALTFAENVTIMNAGEIVQTGTPEQLHEKPENIFVGYFIGSPGMNVLECEYDAGTFSFDGNSFSVSDKLADQLRDHGKFITVGIRPEYVELFTSEQKKAISGTVKLVDDVAAYKVITIRLGTVEIKGRAQESLKIEDGSSVWIRLPEQHLMFYKNGKIIL
jgi:glycerol transport system ATP-binding protein